MEYLKSVDTNKIIDDYTENQELISQLAQLGIKPHNYNEQQQDQKYRLWEKELAIPWKKRKYQQQQQQENKQQIG